MKIGIFGGTFDPVHTGHLIVAECVREKIALDRVVFVPAAIPPHKQRSEVLDVIHRLEMLRLAVAENNEFEVSDIEARRGGISYTIDTLKDLKNLRPDAEWFAIIGMDNLRDFPSWKSPGDILKLAKLVVMTRPDVPSSEILEEMKEAVTLCEVPNIAIASSDVRRRVREKKSIRYLVPSLIEAYIADHHLYQ